MVRPITRSLVPWLLGGLAALSLLVSCGRPAPEGEAALGSEPDPASDSVTDSPVTESSVGDEQETQAAQQSDQVTDDGQMSEQMADQETDTATDSTVAAQTEATPVVAAPIIITADNLSGVVDQSPDRAGVRITSSSPVVSTTPVMETTTTTVLIEAGIHVVQPGDTLSVIAETYGVPVASIAAANGLGDVDTIKPGQELLIPAQ